MNDVMARRLTGTCAPAWRHMTANEDGALATGQDPGRVLLDKIEAREQALARQAERPAPR